MRIYLPSITKLVGSFFVLKIREGWLIKVIENEKHVIYTLFCKNCIHIFNSTGDSFAPFSIHVQSIDPNMPIVNAFANEPLGKHPYFLSKGIFRNKVKQ